MRMKLMYSGMCDAVCVSRMAFPSAEVRYVEHDGASEVVYGGLVARMNAASLGAHSGTVLLSCIVAHRMFCALCGLS